MRVEFRTARQTLLARRAFTGLASPPNPDDRRGVAHTKAGGDLPSRSARQRGVDYAIRGLHYAARN